MPSSYRICPGEPTNSAGMPIYGQLQAFNVTNVLVVVVRYFGGTKLGVGGLIQAYKAAAKLSLEESEIVQRTIKEEFVFFIFQNIPFWGIFELAIMVTFVLCNNGGNTGLVHCK